MQGLCVLTSASEPGGDGGLSVAEDPLSGGRVQTFRERRQHQSDLVRRGFQTVQGRALLQKVLRPNNEACNSCINVNSKQNERLFYPFSDLSIFK